MGVGYYLVNHTRREYVLYAHIDASKARELAGNPVAAAITTWKPVLRTLRIIRARLLPVVRLRGSPRLDVRLPNAHRFLHGLGALRVLIGQVVLLTEVVGELEQSEHRGV